MTVDDLADALVSGTHYMIMRCVVFELALRMVREEWKLAAIMAEFGAEVSDSDPSRQSRRRWPGRRSATPEGRRREMTDLASGLLRVVG